MNPLGIGCRVTAYGYGDALGLLQSQVFGGRGFVF